MNKKTKSTYSSYLIKSGDNSTLKVGFKNKVQHGKAIYNHVSKKIIIKGFLNKVKAYGECIEYK